jgi:hypothetical protein
VLAEQPPVQVRRPGAQAGTLGDPHRSVVTQPDLGTLGISPLTRAHLSLDLGLIRARHGDLDESVHHGLTAFSFDRKTEASLLSHATDLDQLLSDRYADERLADEFHQRFQDARTDLRRKAHADS